MGGNGGLALASCLSWLCWLQISQKHYRLVVAIRNLPHARVFFKNQRTMRCFFHHLAVPTTTSQNGNRHQSLSQNNNKIIYLLELQVCKISYVFCVCILNSLARQNPLHALFRFELLGIAECQSKSNIIVIMY